MRKPASTAILHWMLTSVNRNSGAEARHEPKQPYSKPADNRVGAKSWGKHGWLSASARTPPRTARLVARRRCNCSKSLQFNGWTQVELIPRSRLTGIIGSPPALPIIFSNCTSGISTTNSVPSTAGRVGTRNKTPWRSNSPTVTLPTGNARIIGVLRNVNVTNVLTSSRLHDGTATAISILNLWSQS
jgi:hypothetical protein